MALLAQDWTVSALAVELRKDKRTISKVIAEGKIKPVSVRGKKRKIKYYRIADIVEAMMGGELLNLEQERAQLAREQTRRLQRENEIEERKLISLEEVVDILQSVSKQIVSILEALPLNIKRRVPILKAKDIEFIKVEIGRCRNAVVKIEVKN